MKIEKNKCDNCKKETEDSHAEIDWIQIEGTKMGDYFNISVSNGRKENGSARNKFYVAGKSLLDFCCFGCLCEYLGFKWEFTEFTKDDTNDTKPTM